MKHLALFFLATAWLAGCATGSQVGRGDSVTVAFANDSANVVEVRVRDSQPVEQVQLIDPNGGVHAAFQLLRDRITERPAAASPGFGMGVGVFGGSSSGVGTGVGLGFPLGVGRSSYEPQVVSTARIRVEDMAAYRAAWERWKVRIVFGPAGAQRLVEVGAPRPPEG